MSTIEKNIQTYKYSDLTEKIIGGAMRVHSAIGPGFPEKVFHRALLIEFDIMNLKCASEVERDIFYRNIKVGCRRLDLFIEEKVLIELKAINEIDNSEVSQIIKLLKPVST